MLLSFIASRSARGLRGDDLRLVVEGIAARYFDPADPFTDSDVDGLIRWANQKDEPPPRDAEPQDDPLAALAPFFVTEDQVLKMKATTMIWRGHIAQAHAAVWSAPPNGGKTTLARKAAAELAADGWSVLFFQEDAGAGDLPMLHAHAAQHGYKLLNSALAGGVPDDQITALHALVRGGADLSNYVMFFDTLKKYVDLMSKNGSREFFRLMRALTQRGATVILLGHTNKHRGPDGKLVFEGVGDVRSDVDEMLYIEASDKDALGVVILTVKPDKVRCKVVEASYRLDTNTMTVEPLDEVVDVVAQRRRAEQEAEDAALIVAVRHALRTTGMPKYRLIQQVAAATDVGERTVRAVVNRYLGTDPQDPHALWLETYIRANNTRYVSLKPTNQPAL
jgi:hypothetical protein